MHKTFQFLTWKSRNASYFTREIEKKFTKKIVEKVNVLQ